MKNDKPQVRRTDGEDRRCTTVNMRRSLWVRLREEYGNVSSKIEELVAAHFEREDARKARRSA